MSDILNSPRKPLLALIMSVILPGLGQLYNGQLNRGFFLFLMFAFITIPFIVFVALILPPAWLFPLLLFSLAATLGLYLFSIWDAWKNARQLAVYQAQPWQQPALYISLILFAYISVIGSATQYVRGQLVEAFYIPSESMTPNVLRGDYLFADKRVNCVGCKRQIRRGDVAIFVYPNNRTRLYIKRIIGLPGDEIRIQSNNVFVNGKSLSRNEPRASLQDVNKDMEISYEQGDKKLYAVTWGQEMSTTAMTITVPPGAAFVLGDNRSGTTDSRNFGTVPLMDVVGLARQIWFSYSPESGIRWSRMGKLVE